MVWWKWKNQTLNKYNISPHQSDELLFNFDNVFQADQTKKQSLEKSVGWAAALEKQQMSSTEEEEFKNNYSR